MKHLPGAIHGLAAAVSAAALLMTSPAVAKPAFDGDWSVSIATSRGDCGGYSYPVRIDHGTIGGEANISGRVADNGAVRVFVGTGTRHASGSGRLSGATGWGTWRAVTCSGTWTAQRL